MSIFILLLPLTEQQVDPSLQLNGKGISFFKQVDLQVSPPSPQFVRTPPFTKF